jgi:hypothetical protein
MSYLSAREATKLSKDAPAKQRAQFCAGVRQDALEKIQEAAKSGLTHAYYCPKPYYSLGNKELALHHLAMHLEAEGYVIEYRREQGILLIQWSRITRPWYVQLWYDILKEFRT